MNKSNAYFITGTAYAGKSTMVRLLAEKYNGIQCEENYHDRYPGELDPAEFPNLTYTRDLQDWHQFVRRTPEEYAAWIQGVSKECEIIELRMLPEICAEGNPVFVDTNISLETLREIKRFFERPDKEKQFIYQLLMEEPDPEAALENYRRTLELLNSQEQYDTFLHSGFPVILRDEDRTIEETLALAEAAFGLK